VSFSIPARFKAIVVSPIGIERLVKCLTRTALGDPDSSIRKECASILDYGCRHVTSPIDIKHLVK